MSGTGAAENADSGEVVTRSVSNLSVESTQAMPVLESASKRPVRVSPVSVPATRNQPRKYSNEDEAQKVENAVRRAKRRRKEIEEKSETTMQH